MKKTLLIIAALLAFASASWAMPPIAQPGGSNIVVNPGMRLMVALESETVTQVARIVADGGTIIDLAWMNRVIRTLKAQSIYTSCKFLADANFAVKKDGSNAVSVLYDISGNNNDAVQATGASQPIWTAAQQNGRAGLVFDGIDDFLGTTASVIGGSNITFMSVASLISYTGNYRNNVFTQYSNGVAITSNWALRLGYVGVQTRDPTSVVDFGVVEKSASDPSSTSYEFGDTLLLNGQYDGSNVSHWTNGDLIAETAATGTPNDIAGLIMRIGREGGINSESNIKFILGLIFNSAITASQRQAVESLLNAYYAIY